jgi:hypothetical protein
MGLSPGKTVFCMVLSDDEGCGRETGEAEEQVEPTWIENLNCFVEVAP